MRGSATNTTDAAAFGYEDSGKLMTATNMPIGRGHALERRPLLLTRTSAMSILGTVQLTNGDVVFVPQPTADPRDPMNMKSWQKTVVVVTLCSLSAMTYALIGGFGGIISFYYPVYMAQGESIRDITHLMTIPTLFMGIGNLVGVPFAIAVGRRIVVLATTLLLIAGAILCASSNSLSLHFFGRMLIGLACGQSENGFPFAQAYQEQEVHFLHERARVLMTQQAVQVVIGAIWQLCASPIAQALSPAWWYYLGAAIAALQFIVAIFFLPETKYPRQSYSPDADVPEPCTVKPPLDYVRFKARTWKSDIRLWAGTPEWDKTMEVYKQCLRFLSFPNMIWIVCLCGLTLGINFAITATYSTVLTRDPYNWPVRYISIANAGQIPIAIFFLPLLGWANDRLTFWKARRNNGLHEPENRLLLMPLPVVTGVLFTVLFGIGAQYPHSFSQILYPAVLAGHFFAFTGTVTTLITYVFDAYPTWAGSGLIVMCAGRGILAYLVSFNVTQFIDSAGWDVTFEAFGTTALLVALFGVPVYFYGKRIRIFTSRWTKSTKP